MQPSERRGIGLAIVAIAIASGLGVGQVKWDLPTLVVLSIETACLVALLTGIAMIWPKLLPWNWKRRPYKPIPAANRDAIVRLSTKLEQRANAYFRASASSWMPPGGMRLDDPQRRAPVDETVKKIQAEFRVAGIEESKAVVDFQRRVEDILTRGRVVTKQTLPDLNAELKTVVKAFQKALDSGDL